jgi:hypothetical protein
MQRVLPLIVLALLGVAVWWLWTTRPRPGEEAQPATPTAAVAPPTAPAASAAAPAGFRLAGVAVGDPESFAVIELPNGSSRLYRIDSEVPGLGRLVGITQTGAEIEGEGGKITLRLKPAATPTADRRRVNGERSDEPTAPPKLPGGRDDTDLEPAA